MERYTIRLPDGLGAVPVDGYGMPELLDRLAAYEDTGLEPEDLRDYLPMLREWRQNTGALRYVIELVKADAEGRLQVLPCRVGDVLWDTEGLTESSSRHIVLGFAVLKCLNMVHLSGGQSLPVSEIGKTVFLTREEAEAALAKEGTSHADL